VVQKHSNAPNGSENKKQQGFSFVSFKKIKESYGVNKEYDTHTFMRFKPSDLDSNFNGLIRIKSLLFNGDILRFNLKP